MWEISMRVPLNHKRDLDNVTKPILDLLTPDARKGILGFVPDDRWCNDIHSQRIPPKQDAWVEIEITLIPPPEK